MDFDRILLFPSDADRIVGDRSVADCHAALSERVQPGVTTLELDHFVERRICELVQSTM